VFIHFDFARAAASGHPFSWIAGQEFSSGETAPLYAAVLATGALVGFRGASLGGFALLVAFASVVSMMGSLHQLVKSRIAWLVGALLIASLGVVAWTLWSGMEGALHCAILLRALVYVRRSRLVSHEERAACERRIACLFALLVLTRPESPVLVAPLAVFVARGSANPIRSLVRSSMAPAVATLAIALLNRSFTGSWASAGAELKLLWSRPDLNDFERSREFASNAVHAFVRIWVTGTAPSPWLMFVLPALALSGLFMLRSRGFVATLLVSAFGWAFLVSWNGVARFQNFRYYVPAVVLVAVAASISLAALSSRRRLRIFGHIWGAVAVALAVFAASRDVQFFAEASGNIRDQQVEMGRKLERALGENDVVLLGDAGAIPYFSHRHAIDAFGLGGYHRMPFVTAARYGEVATLELIERLVPSNRPSHLVLYPNWFGVITSSFGVELDRVTLDHNVICGGVSKVLYRANWESLDPNGASDSFDGRDPAYDELDVADVVSEREHDYVEPTFRGAGLVMARLVAPGGAYQAPRFDGGRVVMEGQRESFRLRLGSAIRHARVQVRTDGVDGNQSTIVRSRSLQRGLGPNVPLTKAPTADSPSSSSPPGQPSSAPADTPHPRPPPWQILEACVGPLESGDRLEIEAVRGPFRDFHVYVFEDSACSP